MIFFQLLRKEDGTRSSALPAKPGMLRECVAKLIPRQNWDKFYILILIDDAQSEEFVFSRSPLLSVDTFMAVTNQGVSP